MAFKKQKSFQNSYEKDKKMTKNHLEENSLEEQNLENREKPYNSPFQLRLLQIITYFIIIFWFLLYTAIAFHEDRLKFITNHFHQEQNTQITNKNTVKENSNLNVKEKGDQK